jgi:predicted nuclease of predicted toxin-antitoxin system
MKILVDQNISFRILPLLTNELPSFEHIKFNHLENSNDYDIFMYARQHHFDAIVTLDEDFNSLQLLHGIPPKIIWLRGNNVKTKHLSEVINQNVQCILSFLEDEDTDCLEIWK